MNDDGNCDPNEMINPECDGSFKLARNPEISKNLKKVDKNYICFCCRDVVLKLDGNVFLYNTKLIRKVSLVELQVDKEPLKVTLQEKILFQQQLESKVAAVIKEKRDMCDKKIEEILDDLEVFKKEVYELVENVKESLVVDEKIADSPMVVPKDKDEPMKKDEITNNTTTNDKSQIKFTKGDEIFDFDEIDQDDLPSDLESQGNETPEEIPEPTPNPHPTIFGSLPIQINVGSMRRGIQEDDKGFEPPHLFAARTFVETGIAMRPSSLSRRVSGL